MKKFNLAACFAFVLAVLIFTSLKFPVAASKDKAQIKLPVVKGESNNDRYKKPDGSLYTADELLATWKKVQQMPTDRGERSVNSWSFVGPAYIQTANTHIWYSGRIRSLELVAPIDTSTDMGLRIGSATGGIWKMHPFLVSAYGESMQSDLPDLAIGSTATNPLNSNIMLAGTGEPFGAWRGMGMYKTWDGGQHWNPVSLPGIIPPAFIKIVYNPRDSNIVHAAVWDTRGYYRSTDGGNTWYRQSTLWGTPTDLAIDPVHPDTMYTALLGDRFYKSTDGGQSWLSMANAPTNFGIANIAVSASSPNILFAVCDSLNSHSMGIFKSTDYGSTWNACPYTDTAGFTGFNFHWNGGHYNQCISIKPTDPNIVLVGGGSLLRSINGWDFVEGPNWESDGHHDNHAMVWKADGSAVFLGNDGGLFYSIDDGYSFSGKMNVLPITQFYKFDINPNNPNYIMGAAQDNAVPCFNGATWNWGCAGDGWNCAYNYDNHSEAMARWNAALSYSSDETQTWGNISGPPTNYDLGEVKYEHSSTLTPPHYNKPYVSAGRDLFAKDPIAGWGQVNANGQFPGNIMQFSISHKTNSTDSNNIYVSMPRQSASKVWKHDRVTGNFVDVTNNLPTDTFTWFWTTTAPRHFDEAFAVKADGSDIYKTTDAAATNWAHLPTTALPSGVVINCLFVNPYNTNEIYIGTRGWGVFKTVTNGYQWARWENGMPLGMDVSDFHMIDSFYTNGKIYLYASSYGRGIWKRELSGNDPSAINEIQQQQHYGLDQVPLSNGAGQVTIRYRTDEAANLGIRIFDISGKEIAAPVSGFQQPGEYTQSFDISNLSAGIYPYALFVNGSAVLSKKLVVVK